MLDARHLDLPKAQTDANAYILGSIGCHNVVITCLPMNCYGTNQTARAAAQILNTFSSVKITLMVGIGAGIPTKAKLGDVVISTEWTQWLFGKTKNGVFEHVGKRYFPPKELSSAMSKLQAEHNLDETKIQQQLDKLRSENQKLSLKYTSIENFGNSEGYPYQTSENGAFQISKGSNSARVHYGLITPGNQVVKDASLRDEIDLRLQSKVLCIETEAAGLMEFPVVIVRGICDYADETKNQFGPDDVVGFLAKQSIYLLELEVGGPRDGFVYGALRWAVNTGNRKILRNIIAMDIDGVRSSACARIDLLTLAVRKGYYDIAELLLEGKDLKAPIYSDRGTILSAAAAESDKRVLLKFFLDKGSEIETKNNLGMTPLSLAIKNWKLQNIIVLLERGADFRGPGEDKDRESNQLLLKIIWRDAEKMTSSNL
ncbi:hypothetical protein TWF225_006959 [Orbilia oligospora]|nr:hypothetical protein TWF225_006959 [Orbilia oligospora]KAF3242718.1 hypothetical protein TWF128_010453 [Orbilia oligospora]KAF3242719.1 hypothetical protein TWF128_010453 [Orbilia oligospora]KAF3264167.1 hypothetical protein TWF217_003319 [Orbilia oligospora]KAF3296081.1 hypothetical protein TWF132_011550 [Orbilia oligospora]